MAGGATTAQSVEPDNRTIPVQFQADGVGVEFYLK